MSHFKSIAILLFSGLAIFLECYLIHAANVEPWDEARQGINALEMWRSGDWWNYTYLGNPDTFNTKPPLVTWLTAATYAVLGPTILSLRLHAILGVFGTLFFAYRILTLCGFRPVFVLLSLLLFISCRGLIGFHVGRNGDVDALFIFFITAAIYHLLRYWNFGYPSGMPLFSFFMVLAFFTKSLAILLLLPGILFYMLTSFSIKKVYHFAFISALFFAVLSMIAFYLITVNINIGYPYAQGANNLWEAIFITDGISRFTDTSFENGYQLFHIFHVLDMTFNPYNYLLYVLIGIGIWHYLNRWQKAKNIENVRQKKPLIRFATYVTVSILFVLQLSINKHRWYLAPAIFWLSVITIDLYLKYSKSFRFNLVFIFTLCTGISLFRVYETSNISVDKTTFFTQKENLISSKDYILAPTYIPQDFAYYLVQQKPVFTVTNSNKNYISFNDQSVHDPLESNNCINGYCFAIE